MRGRPWTASGFATRFQRVKLKDRDLHFHDLRGTAATKFYVAGLSIRVIAEILAWSEDQVERIIRRYVARTAATKAAIQQLQRGQKENIVCKTGCKTLWPIPAKSWSG
jgi:integrase